MKYLRNREELLKHKQYLSWKRKNVSIRGIAKFGEFNKGGASMGEGLYTACLANKEMARKYGKVYFVVNTRPKNPLKFRNFWQWEIYLQNLMIRVTGDDFYKVKDFYDKTTIKDEIQKLGYDGIEIVGREYVNYQPKDILYFDTEWQLENYFNQINPHV